MELETTIDFPKKAKRLWRKLADMALEERDEIGLHVPENFKISLGLYQSDSDAMAQPSSKGRNVLLINTVMTHLRPDEQGEAAREAKRKVCNYLTISREALPGVKERETLEAAFSRNPERSFQNLLERKYSKDARRWLAESSVSRGVSLEDFLEYLSSGAKQFRRYVREIKKNIGQAHGSISVHNAEKLMRHEVDHLAFYDGKLKQTEDSLLKRKADLEMDVLGKGKKEKSPDLAAANMELLAFDLSYLPLLESAAHIFDFVPYRGWDNFRSNPEPVKRRILLHVLANYIYDSDYEDCYPQMIAEALVSKRWASGQMNRQTSNLVFRKTRGRTGRRSYLIKTPEEVSTDVAAAIFFREIPAYQDKFYQASKQAIDALAAAYRENPSRLKRAYLLAESFDDFIGIASGKRETKPAP